MAVPPKFRGLRRLRDSRLAAGRIYLRASTDILSMPGMPVPPGITDKDQASARARQEIACWPHAERGRMAAARQAWPQPGCASANRRRSKVLLRRG